MSERADSELLRTKVFSERTVYDNPWVRLSLVEIEPPNSKRFEHHVVHLSPIAIALLVNDHDEVLMLWRHRFATDAWGYEFLGGLVEPGESPVDAAAREALEESGWKPQGEAEHVASFQPLPGMVDSPVDIFVWRKVEKIGEPTDKEEAAITHWVPIRDLTKMLADQKLLGAGTIIAAQYLLMRNV